LTKYGYEPIETEAVPESVKPASVSTASLYDPDDVDEL